MNSNTQFDYVIIGAGPAGLQLGYFLEKANRSYLILEGEDSPGASFKKFPRHGKLISINKLYTGYDDAEINLRWDWNSLLCDNENLLLKNYSRDYFPQAKEFVRYLGDFVSYYDLNIKYGCKIVRIAKNDDFMVIDSNGNVYSSERLIVATGFAKPYIPPIPGIELAENYVNVSIDPEDFANQKVLIIGKGNSGFETADNLVATTSLIHVVSPTPIEMAWKSRYVGHLRAVNNNFLDTYQLKSQNVVLNAIVSKIEYQNEKFVVSFFYTHANGEQEDLIYDRVIVCAGFRFDDSLFDESCRPKLTINDRFPEQTSEWESTNVKDLYFAGVLMHQRDYKKKQSGFIHGFRYNIRALHHILERKYNGKELPSQLVEPTAQGLTKAIIERVNRSSGLWQQTGFLCDLIVISDNGRVAQHYQEMPLDYIHDSELNTNEHYYIISLEFGHEILAEYPDPFAIVRVHKDDVNNAAESPSLHPIVRRFCGNQLIAEHHVIEDIASEWIEDGHIIPLQTFLQAQLLREVKPLGAYLVEAGLLTVTQVKVALDKQKTTPIRLGEIISQQGWVSQSTIEYMMEKVILPEREGLITSELVASA
ncbi:NAD(P)-binding domain-containing protein [Lusitaniella coriacea LEGE 07157]|uniref:NAD(P)-binding domain-containing protein n=1 Tax=Lusitaniella coriacea LEGE 07157 TaxID=945747 RepID=A0A8J7B8W1_9CYAN|nr:NAD(P)-binding domain-containing protein [Lusitaniella coriacea]MBE9115288.1 NAD(P)-binding domain-containing protein [Lusitaniella coriacea LEGE 07157]